MNRTTPYLPQLSYLPYGATATAAVIFYSVSVIQTFLSSKSSKSVSMSILVLFVV